MMSEYSRIKRYTIKTFEKYCESETGDSCECLNAQGNCGYFNKQLQHKKTHSFYRRCSDCFDHFPLTNYKGD